MAGLNAFSQEEKIDVGDLIKLTGKVVIGDSLEPVPYAHVINKKLNRGTISDREGNFEIAIRSTDSLLFTALGFSEYEYFLPDSLRNAEQVNLTIPLLAKSYKLGAVEITGWNFRDRFMNIQNPEAKFKIPEVEKSDNLPRPTIPSIGSPITGLYNAFSRKVQLEKDGLAFIDKLTYHERVDSIFKTEAVKQITGMSDLELNNFIVFCNFSSGLVNRANSYDLLFAIKRCYRNYQLHIEAGRL